MQSRIGNPYSKIRCSRTFVFGPVVLVLLMVFSSVHVNPVLGQGNTSTGTEKKKLPYPPPNEASPDTGRMVPRAEWDRYIVPGMCLAAARNIQHRTDRIDRQSFVINPDGIIGVQRDTLTTATVAASRACGSRFTVEQVPQSELINLFILSTWMSDTSLASATLQRQLSFATSLEDRGNVMRRGVEVLLGARPAQLERARALVKQIDELGPEARMARIRTYRALIQFYVERVGDFAEASRISNAVIAVNSLITKEDLELGLFSDDILAPYMNMVRDAMYDDPGSAFALFEKAVASIRSLGLNEMADGLSSLGAMYYECCLSKIGSSFTPFTPTHVISRDGKLATGESRAIPRPGKITVLIPLDNGWRAGGMRVTNFLEAVRQIDSAYGDRIDIVVCAKTAGFTPGSLSQEPAEEVESIRQYFYEKNSMLARLAVYEAPVITLPDGRKIRDIVPYEAVFEGGLDFVVIDANGNFQRLMRGVLGDPFGMKRVMASVLSPNESKSASNVNNTRQ